MTKNEDYKAKAKEIIKEAYPVFNGDIDVTNDEELEALLIKLEAGYKALVEQFLIDFRKDIIEYIELTSPQIHKTKRDAQNDYVMASFKQSLLNYKKPDRDTVYIALWSFKQKTRDSSHDYD